MISHDNFSGLIAILVGILVFKASTYITAVEGVISKYPIYVIIGALGLFFYRKKITDKIINTKKKIGG